MINILTEVALPVFDSYKDTGSPETKLNVEYDPTRISGSDAVGVIDTSGLVFTIDDKEIRET